MGNRLNKEASNEDDRNTKHVLLRMSEAEYWEPLKNKSIAEYLDENEETKEIAILANGDINLDCSCLQSALAHRCGSFLRDAIFCFNNSKASPRGIDCEERFLRQIECRESYENSL